MEMNGDKAEHMTHLRGAALVPKTHPRIRLRGRLDSLEALVLLTIQQARQAGRFETEAALEELYLFTQKILACEVKGQALPAFSLLGLDSAGLRRASHHPQAHAGSSHALPHSGMPSLALWLNYLRTQAREAELCACEAFTTDESIQRPDLIEALNRLSSAVYLLLLAELDGSEKLRNQS
ncbi:MAG: hypothetical protein FWH26_08930 [Oscillospiraceae bacterium]|nr:hypothetical protein [Oscillospiraceae bacterium]